MHFISDTLNIHDGVGVTVARGCGNKTQDGVQFPGHHQNGEDMTLKEWRKLNDKTQPWVAEQIGVTYQAVQKWETRGLDSMSRIKAIHELTNGEVTAEDWL